MRLFIRMFAIAFGFFAGCLAAGLSYVFLAKLIVPGDFGRLGDLEVTVTLLFGVAGVASLFARAALVPAMAIIAAFEFLKWRDWLSHAIAGAVLALALTSFPLLQAGTGVQTTGYDPVAMIAIRVACAIIGASTYWLVAGRNSGRWLPSERRTDQSSRDPDDRD